MKRTIFKYIQTSHIYYQNCESTSQNSSLHTKLLYPTHAKSYGFS